MGRNDGGAGRRPQAIAVIVVFGSINLDLIFPLPSLPQVGETILTPSVRVEPGGKGANQALAAARDGARVIMAGAVGRDALAAGALSLLRVDGVDLRRVRETGVATGCAAIFVDREGRNVIGVGSGANLSARADQVEDALLTTDNTVLLQMEVPAEETASLIKRARERGARIVLNLAPAGELSLEALRAVHVLVVNPGEAEWLGQRLGADRSAEALRGRLGCAVVRTVGAGGAELASGSGVFLVPGMRVTAVDTTAAGDCFTGVLAAALDRGASLEDAARRANAAAAICCTRAGSQATMPLRAEIEAARAGAQ